jgi:hypothetical protein
MNAYDQLEGRQSNKHCLSSIFQMQVIEGGQSDRWPSNDQKLGIQDVYFLAIDQDFFVCDQCWNLCVWHVQFND